MFSVYSSKYVTLLFERGYIMPYLYSGLITSYKDIHILGFYINFVEL